jgi:hypothetical protein
MLLPDFFESGDRRGRQALRVRADQRGQRFAEVARADAFEVQPGNQLFEATRLPQVRRKNLGGEDFALLAAAIQNPRLLDFHRAEAREDRPLGQTPVADDLAAAGGVGHMRVRINPLRDFRLDRLS